MANDEDKYPKTVEAIMRQFLVALSGRDCFDDEALAKIQALAADGLTDVDAIHAALIPVETTDEDPKT